jgi:hypothetical protein
LEKEEGDALASVVAGSAPAPSAPDPPLALVLRWEGRPAGEQEEERSVRDEGGGSWRRGDEERGEKPLVSQECAHGAGYRILQLCLRLPLESLQ